MSGLSQIGGDKREAVGTKDLRHFVTAVRDLADQLAVWMLAPLGLLILLNGLDDLVVDLMWAYYWLRRVLLRRPPVPLPTEADLDSTPEKRIAVFVPLWHEHEVISDMLAHNISAVRYRNYHFFVGVYPNDRLTVDAVQAASRRFVNVHEAICPHDGPTSKPDCLNWIFQRMLLYEEVNGVEFDIVLTHDAEDLMHPESLRWINHYSSSYGFVQIPVLALRTPALELTHGVYCDEFAEFQTRDLPVRNRMGSFVPSSGVGTAYAREAIELLASTNSNRVFDPGCLTEDYENGYRLHQLGIRQFFVPIAGGASPIATREFFPRRLASAIRQRTRWVTGIALQGWELHGWSGGWRQVFWLWRDRKGLFASPLSLLTNLVCAYGLSSRIWDRVNPPSQLVHLLGITLALQIIRMGVRMGCSARIYGLGFSLMVPVRAIAGNLINAMAVVRAIHRYLHAKVTGEKLVWVKTEHAYPSRQALLGTRRRIGEILVGLGYLEQTDLDEALAIKPATVRLGEYLVGLGMIGEEELYEGLAIQQLLPLADIPLRSVTRRVARALPAAVSSQWNVLPFRVTSGRLDVACPDLPAAALETALREHTALEIRFHLITPMRYRELAEKLNAYRSRAATRRLNFFIL